MCLFQITISKLILAKKQENPIDKSKEYVQNRFQKCSSSFSFNWSFSKNMAIFRDLARPGFFTKSCTIKSTASSVNWMSRADNFNSVSTLLILSTTGNVLCS